MLIMNANREDFEFILNNLPKDAKGEKLAKKIKRVLTPIAVSNRKQKGRNLQHWICERISKLIEIPFENQNDESLILSRQMGQSGADVILRGEARKKFPYTVECKNVETIHFREFVTQAQKYSDEGGWLLVIRTKSIPETTVTMSWATFEKLFEGKEITK